MNIPVWTWKKLFDGVSVVDFLKSQWQNSDMWSRKELAKKYNISNYNGSASQNIELLWKLKSWSAAPANVNQAPSQNSAPQKDVDPIVSLLGSDSEPSRNEIIMQKSQDNATYGKDPVIDNILASKYINPSRNIDQSTMDKIGMDTGLYADIENIQQEILDMYKTISLPDNDIFSRTDISNAEKIALSRERKNTVNNKITQLRRLQASKQVDVKYLAEADQKRAEAQANLVKQNLEYAKLLRDDRDYDLQLRKYNLDLQWVRMDNIKSNRDFSLDERSQQLKENEFYSNNFNAPSWELWTLTWRSGKDLTFSAEWAPALQAIITQGIQVDENNLYRTADDQLKLYGKWRTAAFLREKWIPEEYAQPKEKVVTWTTQSKHMTWNAVDVLVPQWQDATAYIESIEPAMNAQWFFRDPELIKIGDLGHFDFKGSKKKEEKDNYEFNTVYDYLNSTNTNIDKEITPETAQSIIKSDIGGYTMPNDKFNNLIKLGKIDSDTANEYASFKVADLLYRDMTDEQILTEIKDLDFDSMTDADKMQELVTFALADKLDTSAGGLFDLWVGIFNLDSEASWYLDDYFEDLAESIDQANSIAAALKEKYNLN